MSRDLTICGVQAQFLSLHDGSHHDDILLAIKNLDFEAWQSTGIVELISYRSKPLGFAIAQIVSDLAENGYGILEGIKTDSSLGVNCMLLSKEALLRVIGWLELTSEAMGVLHDNIPFSAQHEEEEFQHALRVCHHPQFSGDEFEWYWIEQERFTQWHMMIENSSFQLYYWEDSH